jgi:exportin-2 (importin alpha re-exporter)
VNALYGHYLFECMAVIITHAAKSGDANMITQIQNTLFDPCKQIMAIESLSPYALQLMTQMLDLQPHESGIPAPFQPLFVELTKVPMWENHGNIPALVRLLQVYLKKAGADALVGQQLQPVLGIVNKLICSRSTEGYSFELLNCVVTKLPRNLTDPFMQGIMNLVFQRLMSGKTQRFIAETIQFLCIYIGKHDLATIIRSIEGIQAGAFGNFTTQMWVPNLQNIVGNQQKKHCVIGMTKFLHDSQIVSQPALWCDAVEATVTMLEGVKDDAAVATAAAEKATLVTDDDMSYHGGFSPLKFTNHTPLVFFLPSLHAVLPSFLQSSLPSNSLKFTNHTPLVFLLPSIPSCSPSILPTIFPSSNSPPPQILSLLPSSSLLL